MSSHIVPVRTYLAVFAALMILMIVTVAAAYGPFGRLHVPIALTIAVIKTLLIMMYFMHLKYSHKLTWLFAGASSLWLLILIAFLVSDFSSRSWIRAPISNQPGEAYFGPLAPSENSASEEGHGGEAPEHAEG